MSKLTSRDMLTGPEWMQDECVEGYRDGRRPHNPYPGANRSPAYIHGFNNARRDAGDMPAIPMHEIVSVWNMIVVSEATA
ncbi:hypothetical protein [Sulfitobacter sp. PM12]|uniref:hypothetical protein n=1 Tax=Sulfitobacter sp. PM12 TaxID=3138497 RepID=UPI00388CF384